MIFQELHRLYDRLRSDPAYGVPSIGRSLQKITFKVVLRPDGTVLTIEDVRDHSGKSPRPMQVEVLGATKSSGSGLNPSLLWDTTQYMLGVKAEDTNAERSRAAFGAFRERHLSVEDVIDDPGFAAVCRFLESWDPASHQDHAVVFDAGRTGYGVFQISGETRYVHESPRIQSWWDDQPLNTNPVRRQCLVTGEVRSIAQTHDKIKGVVGGQGAGGTIAGFNDPAYESYGLSQSFNAPVGEAVAFKYVTALNALLDGPKKNRHRILLGDSTVAFWTDRPSLVEDFFKLFATTGSRGLEDDAEAQHEGVRTRLQSILESIRRGQADPSSLDVYPGTDYHILALSPNSARIAVRFYYQGSVSELVACIAAHYRDLALVRRESSGKWRGDPEFPSLKDLLEQTARDKKDVPPLLEAPLLKAAMLGQPYPPALYMAVLRRLAADRKVTYLRGCIIKGFLNRNLNMEMTMALDVARRDPGYRLGRLFAALEKTQQDALGKGLNRTIRDAYYGSASATPRSVFPRLLRTYQHHLAKLEGGFRVNRERLVQEIMGPLAEFPSHLDLAGQGLFAIGYYHQTDAFYQKRDVPTVEQSTV
jgi:CRISPR-associated protein Csd1